MEDYTSFDTLFVPSIKIGEKQANELLHIFEGHQNSNLFSKAIAPPEISPSPVLIKSANPHPYLDRFYARPTLAEAWLAFIAPGYTPSNTPFSHLIDPLKNPSSGLYLRWNHRGLVINPTIGFLEHFHELGFHLHDIHHIIVTKPISEAYAEIALIYDLNHAINTHLQHPHIIHYHLIPQSFDALSKHLKPRFKQEKQMVQRLELFENSGDGELTALEPGIQLRYFSTTSSQDPQNTLGIRLELRQQDLQGNPIPITHSIGYVSGTPWSPILNAHLENCDIVIAGLGSVEDCLNGMHKYQDRCLGYYGALAIASEVRPNLMIGTEFYGHAGDLRLSMFKKLREVLAKNCPQKSIVAIPADKGLQMNLLDLTLQSTLDSQTIACENLAICQTEAHFGRLHYLAKEAIFYPEMV